MMKSLLLILLIVFIAAVTSNCGVTGKLRLPEGEQRTTVLGDGPPTTEQPTIDKKSF